MPIDPSIALGAKGIELPNPLQTAMQAQALRNQSLQGNQLQMSMGANQAASEAIQKHTKSDGSVDLAGVQATLANDPRAAFNGQAALGTNLDQQGKQIANTGAGLGLSIEQVNQAIQNLGTLAQKKDLSATDIIGSLAQNVKSGQLSPQQMATLMNEPDFPAVGSSPNDVQKYIQLHLARAQSAAQQLQAQTPQVVMVNNGRQQIPTNFNANAGPIAPIPGSTPIPNQLSPGQLESIETDAAGNKHVVSRSPQGTILSTRPMPGSAQPGQPGTFTNMAPGQASDIMDAQKEVQGVRSAGDQAPTQHNINSQILRLSKDSATGPGTQSWMNALGGVSAMWGGTDKVNNYQELGKYLEKNAIANMQSMGGSPSDARLNAASAANGSTSFNAGALQDVTKFNDATTSAVEKYRQGMDKAVGLKNSDYTALPAFKSAWAKNLDVNVFRIENAIRDGDTAELEKLKKEFTPQQMKQLAQKRLNLETLSGTGRLPQ